MCDVHFDYICADDQQTWVHFEDGVEEGVDVFFEWGGRAMPAEKHPTNIAWWRATQIKNDTFDARRDFFVIAERDGVPCDVYDRIDALEAGRLSGVLRASDCNIPPIDLECSPYCEMEGCEITPMDYDNPYCATIDAKTCVNSTACSAEGECDFLPDENFCFATKAWCQKSFACRLEGRCFAINGQCVAGSNEACRQSADCLTFGRCHYDPNAGGCVPRVDRDCSQSDVCKNEGKCRAGYQEFNARPIRTCVAACDGDCSKTDACKSENRCWVGREGSCSTRKIGTLGERPGCESELAEPFSEHEPAVFSMSASTECHDEVEYELRERDEDLLLCYVGLLDRRPKTTGEAVLKASFDENGKPVDISLSFDLGLKEQKFNKCIERAFQKMGGPDFKNCGFEMPIHFYFSGA